MRWSYIVEAEPLLKQVKIKLLYIQYWFDLGILPVLRKPRWWCRPFSLGLSEGYRVAKLTRLRFSDLGGAPLYYWLWGFPGQAGDSRSWRVRKPAHGSPWPCPCPPVSVSQIGGGVSLLRCWISLCPSSAPSSSIALSSLSVKIQSPGHGSRILHSLACASPATGLLTGSDRPSTYLPQGLCMCICLECPFLMCARLTSSVQRGSSHMSSFRRGVFWPWHPTFSSSFIWLRFSP